MALAWLLPTLLGLLRITFNETQKMTPKEVHKALVKDTTQEQMIWIYQFCLPNPLLNTPKLTEDA